jgi:hypothetical protein
MRILSLTLLITFLKSSLIYASPEFEMSIKKGKERMEREITKSQRSMKKDCGTKLKVSLDYSQLEALEINEKYTQFLRLRKKVNAVTEAIFKKCKKSDFKQDLKKYKKIKITAVRGTAWRVRGNSGLISIDIGEGNGDNFEGLLEKKI